MKQLSIFLLSFFLCASVSAQDIINHSPCGIRITEVCYDINAQPVPFIYPSTTYTYGATVTISGYSTLPFSSIVSACSTAPGNYIAYEVCYDDPTCIQAGQCVIIENGICCGWVNTPVTPPIWDNHNAVPACQVECGSECAHFDLNNGDLHFGY